MTLILQTLGIKHIYHVSGSSVVHVSSCFFIFQWLDVWLGDTNCVRQSTQDSNEACSCVCCLHVIAFSKFWSLKPSVLSPYLSPAGWPLTHCIPWFGFFSGNHLESYWPKMAIYFSTLAPTESPLKWSELLKVAGPVLNTYMYIYIYRWNVCG